MRSGKRHITTTIFILMAGLIPGISLYAQLSPGDLTKAHAHLEGISNCTKCHVLGDKVTNDKCLACHKEIKSRVDQRKGFHASTEVMGKDCFACHSEHHGRNFEIVRFDEERFNHALTGYKLTGAHLQQDCRACHKPDNIESAELKKNTNTYLGLNTTCISCHTDVHQTTLGTNCASCHTTTSFVPATLFDHAKTEFPLRGQHRNVDCKSCHMVTVSNGQLIQKFNGVPFNNCADCHTDVHNSQFGENCKECHNEESFQTLNSKITFNHNQTELPLLGKHKTVNCASCHQLTANTTHTNAFQEFKGKNIQNCVTCHADVHDSKFGSDCRQCHTEESFRKIRNLDNFEHSMTGFPLEGKHVTVDCKQCHETRLTDPIPHNLCMDCHEDFHEGQFVSNNIKPDCRECHSVEGFEGSLYTIEQHNQTSFPLTGSHLAIPCSSCHLKNEEWTFRNIGTTCKECHKDVHEGFLSEKYYPSKDCIQCHQPEGWADIKFDHGQTGFELKGRHKVVSCSACHVPDTISTTERMIPLTGLKATCVECHQNVHGDQFEINQTTDCARCHGFEQWTPGVFDHNTARFVLDGAHKNVACNECHKPETDSSESHVIIYRNEKLDCMDCHL